MKNKRGGSYFSFHGKHAVLFFQVEGWPHRQVLDVSRSVIAPTSFVLQKYIGGSACHGAAKHIPQGFGGCRVFAMHFPEMKNERGGSCFSFHGKHTVLFFQVVGRPQVLDV